MWLLMHANIFMQLLKLKQGHFLKIHICKFIRCHKLQPQYVFSNWHKCTDHKISFHSFYSLLDSNCMYQSWGHSKTLIVLGFFLFFCRDSVEDNIKPIGDYTLFQSPWATHIDQPHWSHSCWLSCSWLSKQLAKHMILENWPF